MIVSTEIEEGDVCYAVEADIDYYSESWGYDYDGRGGVDCNKMEVLEINVFDENDNDVTGEVLSKIQTKVDRWLDNVELY